MRKAVSASISGLLLITLLFTIFVSFPVVQAAEKTVYIGEVYGNPTEVFPKTVTCVRSQDSVNWDISMSTYDRGKLGVADTVRVRFIGPDLWGGAGTIIVLKPGANPRPIVTAPPGTYQYVVEFLKNGAVIDTADPEICIAPPKEVPAITPPGFLLALIALIGLAAIAMRKMYK